MHALAAILQTRAPTASGAKRLGSLRSRRPGRSRDRRPRWPRREADRVRREAAQFTGIPAAKTSAVIDCQRPRLQQRPHRSSGLLPLTTVWKCRDRLLRLKELGAAPADLFWLSSRSRRGNRSLSRPRRPTCRTSSTKSQKRRGGRRSRSNSSRSRNCSRACPGTSGAPRAHTLLTLVDHRRGALLSGLRRVAPFYACRAWRVSGLRPRDRAPAPLCQDKNSPVSPPGFTPPPHRDRADEVAGSGRRNRRAGELARSLPAALFVKAELLPERRRRISPTSRRATFLPRRRIAPRSHFGSATAIAR